MQFQAGNRQDLVDKEAAEIALLQGYLPAQLERRRNRCADRRGDRGHRRREHQGHGQGHGHHQGQGAGPRRHGRRRRQNQSQARRLIARRRSMAGRIPQPFIDEIVARSDIVEIIGARVPLKKSGREYKACCPFHSREIALLLGEPREAVLSLLRLRRARHRGRLSHAIREAGVPRRDGGSRAARGPRNAARGAERARARQRRSLRGHGRRRAFLRAEPGGQ